MCAPHSAILGGIWYDYCVLFYDGNGVAKITMLYQN